MDFLPQVPLDEIQGPLRGHIDRMEALGMETVFHRYLAHSPAAAGFYYRDFYDRFFFRGAVDLRSKEVARLVLAVMSGCPFCQQNDIESALSHGVTQADVDRIMDLDFDGLAIRDSVVARLAATTSPFSDGAVMGRDEWDSVRAEFSDEEIGEILMCLAMLGGMGRVLVMTGFVKRECPLPGPPTVTANSLQ